MSHHEYVAGLVEELRAASREDQARVEQAQAVLERAERTLAGAQLRAEATTTALSALEERLKALSSPPPGHDGVRQDEKGPTTDELILDFLAGRQKAATREIVEHVRTVKPNADSGKVSPRLTHLKSAGRIVHIDTGWWRIAAAEDK
ncbi:hypothetical protein QZH56_20995 [Streptomyces olivoreticuli]|uniref:hypothetical protein n=1 Tax=Streptomyces olivoreticuli TaxID=68246 RepID=UPI002658AC02|nr:hypothetical protein [Streptomyces olivoreticuli]WKK21339.1 hypothetical protein QZH56_20995 [Streptomyces olivoreticuli]